MVFILDLHSQHNIGKPLVSFLMKLIIKDWMKDLWFLGVMLSLHARLVAHQVVA